MSWIVKDSRRVLHDRWISVRADHCETASGITIAPFYVLEYPDFAHVVAIDRFDHVVLVKQYRHGYGGMSLELPGGMMDEVDSDPVNAAMRELMEETGFAGETSNRLLMSLSPNPATHSNRLHLVLARDVELRGSPRPDYGEEISVVRIPIREAMNLAIRGDIVHSSHIGLLLIGLNAVSQPQAP